MKSQTLLELLIEDLRISRSQFIDKPISEIGDFDKRNFFRVTFSTTEGIISILKTDCLETVVDKKIALSTGENAFLREETYYLKSNGSIELKPNFINLKNNIKAFFLLSKKVYGFDYEPDFKSAGWNKFLKSIKKRNLITHPKSIEDLIVSDKEIEDLFIGIVWMYDNVINYFRLRSTLLEKDLDEKYLELKSAKSINKQLMNQLDSLYSKYKK